MENRLLKYREDLTYPEWMSEHGEKVQRLYDSSKDDPDFPPIEFLSFSIEIYLETEHARNIANQYEEE